MEYEVARRGNYPATRVDYVLKDATGEPAIVIEAKRIDVESDDERALDQMERYLQDIPTATMAVGHNGQYWNIAKREGNDWQPESRYPPLGLHYEKTGENAQRLWDTLSKEAVKQHAQAERQLRSSKPRDNPPGRSRVYQSAVSTGEEGKVQRRAPALPTTTGSAGPPRSIAISQKDMADIATSSASQVEGPRLEPPTPTGRFAGSQPERGVSSPSSITGTRKGSTSASHSTSIGEIMSPTIASNHPLVIPK